MASEAFGRHVGDFEPVLIGLGTVMQRVDSAEHADEPLALMLRAVLHAGDDCGAPDVLRAIERIYVPKGRWRYRDPGRAIADRIGATHASTVLAKVGVLQERLIADACSLIAHGEIRCALVVGGEAGFRLLLSRIAGRDAIDVQQESEPDEVWQAPEPIMTPIELATLGELAPAYYAVIDSAWRDRRGVSVERHRSDLADLYSRFSDVASSNPEAWKRSSVDAASIRDASPKNPMLAFPYTKLHTSDWSVDQASALLFCSVATARAMGVPVDRWIFPSVSALSDHMLPLSERPDLDRCLGAELAASAALSATNLTAADIDVIDVYSCFPSAVLIHAAALGVPLSRTPTITGGMRFGGGPFNNYVLHATAQAARAVRNTPGRAAVSSVSGVLTKHAFSIWSGVPGDVYRFIDVTDQTASAIARRRVVERYVGHGRVAGYTVLHDNGLAGSGVAVIDTDEGARALAVCDDDRVVASMMHESFSGRSVEVADGHFTIAADHA